MKEQTRIDDPQYPKTVTGEPGRWQGGRHYAPGQGGVEWHKLDGDYSSIHAQFGIVQLEDKSWLSDTYWDEKIVCSSRMQALDVAVSRVKEAARHARLADAEGSLISRWADSCRGGFPIIAGSAWVELDRSDIRWLNTVPQSSFARKGDHSWRLEAPDGTYLEFVAYSKSAKDDILTPAARPEATPVGRVLLLAAWGKGNMSEGGSTMSKVKVRATIKAIRNDVEDAEVPVLDHGGQLGLF